MKSLSPIALMMALASPAPASTPVSETFHALFGDLHARDVFHGNVLVAEQGQVVFEASYGLADDATGLTLTADTLFELASVAKPLTALAVMLLHEDGLLRYEDPVATHLPDYPHRDVTVRHLLQHTSGIPSHSVAYEFVTANLGDDQPLTNDHVMQALKEARLDLVARPGSAFVYSNLNSIVLAEIVEALCECPLAEFLASRIFEPAGMSTARLTPPPGTPVPSLAIDYLRDEATGAWVPSARSPGMEWLVTLGATRGDGGVLARARDLLALDVALREERLLDAGKFAEALQPAVDPKGDEIWERSWVTSSYGFGWRVGEDRRTHWHTGNWGGFNTAMKRYPHTGRLLVYLANRRIDDWSWLERLEVLMTSPSPWLERRK